MSDNVIKIGSKYKHFKGKEYLIINIAKNSETMEDMVVYQALYGDKSIWVRPLGMFLDYINVKGSSIRRFQEIE